MENKQDAENTSRTADSSAAAFMADILQKFGGPEKAMEAFAMFASVMGKSVPAGPTSAAPPPEVPGTSTSQPEAVAETVVTVPESTAAETHDGEADLAAELEVLAVNEPRLDSVTEGETPVTDCRAEGETPVEEVVEGETPVLEEVVEGDEALNLEGNLEGETPVVGVNVLEGD